MERIEDCKEILTKVMNMLENQFGKNCEIVLHDFSKSIDQTIVDIRNGHVTNRKVGGCGSNLGLEVMRGTVSDDDRYNYITFAPNGTILRSSSIHFKNSQGELIGSLCVNLDITESIRFENYLKEYNSFQQSSTQVNEFFSSDVHQLLEELIHRALSFVNKPVDAMTKEDKLVLIEYLDKKGAFAIQKSSDRVSEVLGISRPTFYNYLDYVRNTNNG